MNNLAAVVAKTSALAKSQSVLKSAFDELSARLDVLEKAAGAEQAARYGFGSADGDQARIAKLEAELAVLKARHGPAAHVEGLAKALERGRASNVPEADESLPAAFPRHFGRA